MTHSADEVIGTAAQEAIRIADTYLRGASIARRRALAMEIVNAINLCNEETVDRVVLGLQQLVSTPHRPEDERS